MSRVGDIDGDICVIRADKFNIEVGDFSSVIFLLSHVGARVVSQSWHETKDG